MFFGKQMLLYIKFTNLARGGRRNDIIDTISDTNQTQNRQAMKANAESFYKENLIERSFLVFKILGEDGAEGWGCYTSQKRPL